MPPAGLPPPPVPNPNNMAAHDLDNQFPPPPVPDPELLKNLYPTAGSVASTVAASAAATTTAAVSAISSTASELLGAASNAGPVDDAAGGSASSSSTGGSGDSDDGDSGLSTSKVVVAALVGTVVAIAFLMLAVMVYRRHRRRRYSRAKDQPTAFNGGEVKVRRSGALHGLPDTLKSSKSKPISVDVQRGYSTLPPSASLLPPSHPSSEDEEEEEVLESTRFPSSALQQLDLDAAAQSGLAFEDTTRTNTLGRKKVVKEKEEEMPASKQQFWVKEFKVLPNKPDDERPDYEPWFHGAMSHAQANKILQANGAKNGLFLVRQSDRSSKKYVLCLCKGGLVYQTAIESVPGGFQKHHGSVFPSIRKMLEAYSDEENEFASEVQTPPRTYVACRESIRNLIMQEEELYKQRALSMDPDVEEAGSSSSATETTARRRVTSSNAPPSPKAGGDDAL
eukprot:m.320503 g.320503  ORF g.320503 m.320503 type:complete len:451 (+) comp24170_c0_seq1:84-1436(+)